jgi:hypothetical protein
MPTDNPELGLVIWYGSAALVGILCVLVLLGWVERRSRSGRHRGKVKASADQVGSPSGMGRHAATHNRAG